VHGPVAMSQWRLGMQLAESSRSEAGQERLQPNEDIFLFAGERRKTAEGMVRLEDMTSLGHT
jgi:hypothetical protein